MRLPWHDVAVGASAIMCIGLIIIITTRCYSNTHLCMNEPEHSTLSWLLDDDWRVTFAAVLIGCCALVHLMLLHVVWTWREMRSNVVTAIRVSWTIGYTASVGVAVFTVTKHEAIHYVVAFIMFVSMIIGAAICLWWQRDRHPYTMWQAVHFVAIVLLVLGYIWTWNGWYEISAIFLMVLYFNWLSLGDHWIEDVVVGMQPEDHVPKMATTFVARGL